MRFYPGIEPMRWLTAVPMCVLSALVAMLPRLESEESLLAAMRTAVGGGTLRQCDSQRVREGWERAAAGGQRRRARKASREELAAMGIQLTVVPRGAQ